MVFFWGGGCWEAGSPLLSPPRHASSPGGRVFFGSDLPEGSREVEEGGAGSGSRGVFFAAGFGSFFACKFPLGERQPCEGGGGRSRAAWSPGRASVSPSPFFLLPAWVGGKQQAGAPRGAGSVCPSFPARVARLGKEKCKRDSVPFPAEPPAVLCGFGGDFAPLCPGEAVLLPPPLQAGCCARVN